MLIDAIAHRSAKNADRIQIVGVDSDRHNVRRRLARTIDFIVKHAFIFCDMIFFIIL
jgi:hypothetical protein